MLSREVAQKVLGRCLITGGDFAEIFEEDSLNNSISILNGKVENSIGGRSYGIGIRIFKGLKSVYAYTNNNSLTSLLNVAQKAALALGDLKEEKMIVLNERENININPIILTPSSIDLNKKIGVMKVAYDSAKNYHSEIAQVGVGYADKEQHILIANTEGLYTEDKRIRTRLTINAIASINGENQTGFEGPGRHMGFEMFNEIDPEYYGKSAARQAYTMLHARNCPAGRMTVAIDNGFGGVIFHEACGHSLEASSVSKNLSVFSNKLGEKIASNIVSAVDDGTIDGAWGSENVDDEGNPTHRNVLIKNGILTSYLIDGFNGRRMNAQENGASRRQSYKYEPTSRMSNTFILGGKSTPEEIIKNTKFGLYAKSLGGGSVNPATGEFNFAANEAYIIKDGKIAYPVKGATLIGSGAEVLKKIDMIGNDLQRAQGMCGAASGSIPTDVGQPTIRVSEMTVGGRGEKLN